MVSISYVFRLVFPLLANTASVTACAWLLWRFHKAGEHVRKRLFARQLLHLAIADLVLAMGTLAYAIIQFYGLDSLGSEASTICGIEVAITVACVHVSTFVETYVALGFMGAYLRHLTMVRFLHVSLPALWLAGFTVAFAEVLPSLHYDITAKCFLKPSPFIHTGPWVLLLCFIIAAIANIATIHRVCKYPGVVQSLVWRSAWVYPVNFFLTYGAAWIYFMFWPAFRDWQIFYEVAIGLIGLNGVVNVLSYAYNSHRIRSALTGQNAGLIGLTFLSSDQSDGSGSDDLMAFISFHVGFKSVLVSELVVSDIQQQARSQSERDLTTLEAARGADMSSDASSSVSSYDWYPPPDPLEEHPTVDPNMTSTIAST